MQKRSSDENSVCLSVERVDCEKKEKKSVHIFTPYERSFSLVFWEKMIGRGNTFYLKFWVNRPPLERNRRFWIIARSASTVTPSEKVQLTLIGSPLRSFHRAWDDHCTLPLSPPKGAQNSKRGFPSKIALRLKKVCYKVTLCENCQRQSCTAFIGLTIHAKIIGGGRPLLLELLGQTDHVRAKSPFFLYIFSPVGPQRNA